MLERVWLKHQSLLRRVAASVLFDRSNVDDVLQDTFVRLLSNGRRFGDEQEAFNYLRRALINTCLDFYRRRQRYRRRIRSSEDLTILPRAVSEGPDPLAQVLSSEQRALETVLSGRVRRAIRSLPPPQREAVELVYGRGAGRQIKEICREHKIPYSTLRSRLLRAFDLIRQEIEAEEESTRTVTPEEQYHEV